MGLTLQNCTTERFIKIQELTKQNREYFDTSIRSNEAKTTLSKLMDTVDKCAQEMFDMLQGIEETTPLSKQIQEMIAPEVSKIANRIFAEIFQIQKGSGPYTSIADRRAAYPKLQALYLEHKPQETIKQTTWQEQALAIEQDLVHHDPRPWNTLLQQIATLAKGEGFSHERKVYLSYAWPSFELAHEQWTHPFLETLTQDLQEVGFLVSSKQMDAPFPCSESDSVLLFGTQSLLKDYAERDSAFLGEVQAMLKMQSQRKDKLDLPVLPILLSGEEATSFPPQLQFDGVINLIGTIRKSYPIFLKGLIEDLYHVPSAKENPNRIEWERAWSSFWDNTNPDQLYFLQNGLDKPAVEHYVEKNQLIRKTAEELQQKNSLRAIDLMERENTTSVQYTQYLKQQAPQRIQAPRGLKRFIGRTKELDAMHTHTLGSDLSREAGLVVLHGRGGVGKSELATQFARKNQSAFSLIYTIRAGSDELVHQAYQELAAILDIYIEKDPHEEIVQKVHRRLEEGLERPWLLIFDNVTESLPLPAQGGAIVVTSQKKKLWPQLQETIDVKAFDFEDALALFEKPTDAQENYKKLFDKLEGLPLLLNQAHQFMQEGVSIDEYLELIEQEHPLWEKTERYPQALAQTYQLTLKRIQQASQDAYDFLKMCAYFQPDQIHKEHLTMWLEQQDKASLRANIHIRTLLIDWSLFEQDGDYFRMHRLLQQVLKKLHATSEKELFGQAVNVVKTGLDKYDHNDPATWQNGKIAVPQINFWFNQDLWKVSVDPLMQANILDEIGTYNQATGQYQNALEFLQKALEIRLEMLGERHPNVAESYNNVGYMYQDMGDYAKALEFKEKALEISLEALGEQHPGVAVIYNNVGSTNVKMGDHAKALEFLQKALEIWLEVLGERHPDVATSYNNVGMTYGEMGDHAKALEFQEKALEIGLEVLGERHPDVAQSYNNVGMTYGEMGDYAKALEFLQKALEIRLEVLGEKHPDVAESYNNVGCMYGKMEDHAKELEFLQNALEIRLEMLGERHPSVAESYNNVGMTYGEMGDHAKALEFLEKAMKIWLEVLGERHANVAMSYNNLGMAYGKMGDHAKELEFEEKALKIGLEVLGERHPDVAQSYNNVGMTYGEMGDYAKALEFLQKALEIRLEVLGEKHPDVAESYNNVGCMYGEMEDYAKELEFLQNALEIRLELLGERHPCVAMSYNNLGMAYGKMGDHAKELEFEEKALKIRLEVLGERHPDVAEGYNNVGYMYGEMEDHAKALEFKKKALKIRLEVLGERHPDVATSYNNVGMTYGEMGDYAKALEFLHEALKVRLEVLGDMHPDVASVYNNVAYTYEKSGNHAKALEFREKALEVRLKVFEEKHPSIASSYNSVGDACLEIGNYTKALQCFQKALKIQLALLGEKHNNTALNYHNIGRTYGRMGNHVKALEFEQKVLEIYRESLGEDHEHTAIIYGSVSWQLANLARYEEGKEHSEKAIEIYKSNYENEYALHCYWVFDNLAFIAQKTSSYDEALNYAERALKFAIKEHRKKGKGTAEFYNRVASIQLGMGASSALKNAQRALSISLKHFGKDHAHTAMAYSLVGLAKAGSGNREGLKDLDKAIRISEKLERSHQVELANSLHAKGRAYQALEEHDQALKDFRKALKVQGKAFPRHHPDTADTLYHIGVSHEKQKEYERALRSYKKALKVQLKHQKSLGRPIAETHNRIASLLIHLNRHDEAIKSCQKAVVIACQSYSRKDAKILFYLEQLFKQLEKSSGDDFIVKTLRQIQKPCKKNLGSKHPVVITIGATIKADNREDRVKKIKEGRKLLNKSRKK